jgi:hypothetical protein
MTEATTPTPAALILSRMRSSELSCGPIMTSDLGQLGLVEKAVWELFQPPSSMCKVPRPMTVPSPVNEADVVVCAAARLFTSTRYAPAAALPSLTADTDEGSLEVVVVAGLVQVLLLASIWAAPM